MNQQKRNYYSSEDDDSPSKKHKSSPVFAQSFYPSRSLSEDSQSGDDSSQLSAADDSIDSEDDRQLQLSISGHGNQVNHDSEDESSPTVGLGGGMNAVAKDFLIKSENKPSSASYNSISQKLMAKMGYKEGSGLGKHGQGRVIPVEASAQKGRRGLGMELGAFRPSDVDWNFEKDEVMIEESVTWIPSCVEREVPELDEMMAWMKIGPKKETIDDETEFCSLKTLTDVLQCKNVFDVLESEEMRRARTRSNPYETIRGGIFQNRAAMKMANMDAILDQMFTSPVDRKGRPVVGPHQLLYFADVCAGPGGFSEYVLWRKKWDAKGFGFTLRGACDFKLEEFFTAPSELFEPHYGKDDDGDVYKPHNLTTFRDFVMENTDGMGVHFVMADGGFSVEGKENIQEILSKRLYLCQFLCAVMILRPGGHFVCKLFDIFTKFSAGLVYLMHRIFDHVSIYKPVTSRPANSERYIVCKYLREDCSPVRDYMFNINLKLDSMSSVLATQDVTDVVPLEMLKEDEGFYNYIYESNESLGIKQAIALAKIQAFAQNSNLHDTRQAETKEKCLKLWNVPDEVRAAPSRDLDKRVKVLEKKEDRSCFSQELKPLNSTTLPKITSVYDYRCVVCGGQRFFFLGLGKSHVYKWESRRNNWVKHDSNIIKFELPRDTIVEAEIVTEMKGEGRAQRRVMTLHIVDALVLCGVDVRNLHFNERIEQLKKFTKAINRPTRSDLAPVRIKDVFKFEEVETIFERLEMRICKNAGQFPQLCYRADSQKGIYFRPQGVVFIKTTKDPWMMAFSRSQKRKYFFNTQTRESVMHIPPDSIASFKSCHESSLHWTWEEGVKVHDSQQKCDPAKLSRDRIMNFVHEKTGR